MSIGKPTADRDSMLGVEDIRCWRVVDNDCFSQITTDLRQVFHIIPLVVIATLAEQTMVYHVVDIELVEKRISVLLKRVS